MPIRLFAKNEKQVITPTSVEREVVENFDRYLSTTRRPAERARIRLMALRTLNAKPDSLQAQVILGYLDMEDGDLEAMMRHFLAALELADNPYNEYTWDIVTVSLNDNLEDAARLARYLTEFYQRKPAGFVAKYLARACMAMGEAEKALPLVDKHLAGFPSDRSMMRLKRRIEAAL